MEARGSNLRAGYRKPWKKRYEELLPLSYPIHHERLIAASGSGGSVSRERLHQQRIHQILLAQHEIGLVTHGEERFAIGRQTHQHHPCATEEEEATLHDGYRW
jgi:hypothetical protein